MRISIFIFLILLIYSCNTKYDEYNESDTMYNILCQDFDSDIDYFIKRNDQTLKLINKDSIKAKKITEFHKLRTDYTEYLSELEMKVILAPESLFFSNDSVSELGLNYLEKNEFYREQFLTLVADEGLRKYILDKLRDKSPPNRNGERIDHMDYYFKGIRKSGTLAYLKNKKRIAYEIEYEYLTSLELTQ